MFANPADTQHSAVGRLSALEGHGRCGVFVLTPHGQVTFASGEGRHLLGLTSTTQALSMPQNLCQFALESLVHSPAAREGLLEVETAGGHLRSFLVWAIPFPTTTATTEIVLVLNDVSDLRLLSDRLPQIDRLTSLGTLSAGMAHELKNSLVSVKTFVDLLLEKNPDAELAKTVRREIGRLESLVTGTLSLGGPDRSRRAPLPLHSTVDQALKLVHSQFSAKGVHLEHAFAANPQLVFGEESQLLQVSVNLLLNALEATPAGGKVSVRTDNPKESGTPPRSHVRLIVADSGMGISQADLPHIFEPFFTTKRRGTGLGLAIARRIISEHDGTIEVSSTPGKGSTFLVVLPVSPLPDGHS